MLLRYSFERDDEADLLEKAVSLTLDQGYRTKDLAYQNEKIVGTAEVTEGVIRNLDYLSANE